MRRNYLFLHENQGLFHLSEVSEAVKPERDGNNLPYFVYEVERQRTHLPTYERFKSHPIIRMSDAAPAIFKVNRERKNED